MNIFRNDMFGMKLSKKKKLLKIITKYNKTSEFMDDKHE